jgi:hypothetical protein
MDLGLDDNRAATQPNRGRLGVSGSESDFSLRDRHAVAREDRLGLIFVDFHEAMGI